MTKKLHAINALKVIAILLVFNSHCTNIYPISQLATGGALGNALFFVISGYFLSGKVDANFGEFIKKKVMQLYPSMLVVSVIYMFIFELYPDSFISFFKTYIWPTGYWFIGGLLLFNCLVYFFDKLNVFENFTLFSIIIWIVYFICYIFLTDKTKWSVEEHGIVRLIYYFYIFVYGYKIRTKKANFDGKKKILFFVACLSAIGSIAWKGVLSYFPETMSFQCICQILGAVFAICSLLFVLEIEGKYNEFPKPIIRLFDYLSMFSLEIYLTQRTAQHLALYFHFPVSLGVALLITCLYAGILKLLIAFLRENKKRYND